MLQTTLPPEHLHKLSLAEFYHIGSTSATPIQQLIGHNVQVGIQKSTQNAIFIIHNIIQLPVKELPSSLVYMSHNMGRYDFYCYLHNKYPTMEPSTLVRIIHYKIFLPSLVN